MRWARRGWSAARRTILVRPLIEAVEAHTVALNRIGGNLNQITAAINRGTVPERAETVLDRVEQAAQNSYHLIDQLLAERHGSWFLTSPPAPTPAD